MFGPHACSSKPMSKKEEQNLQRNLLIRLKDFLRDISQLSDDHKKVEELIKKTDQMLSHTVVHVPVKPATPFDDISDIEDKMAPPPPMERDEENIGEGLEELMQAVCKESQDIIVNCLDQKSADKNQKVLKMEEELKALTEERKKLEERNKHLERTKARLANQLDESLDAIDQLKRQVFSLEKDMSKLAENNQKIDSEKRHLEQNLKSKVEKCEKLNNELKELNKKIEQKEKDIHNLSVEKKDLLDILNQNDLETLSVIKEKKELQETLKKLEKANSELEISHIYLEEKLTETEEGNQEIIKEKEEMAHKLVQKEKEISTLNQDIEQHKAQIEALEKQIDRLGNEKLKLEEKLNSVEKAINQTQSEKDVELVKKQEEIEQLKLSLEELRSELVRVNELNQTLRVQSQSSRQKAEELEKIHVDMTKERENMVVQIIHLEIEVEDLRKTLQLNREDNTTKTQEFQDKSREMHEKLETLEKKHAAVTEEKEKLIFQLLEKEKQIQKLILTLGESQKELTRLSSFLDEKMSSLDATIEQLSGPKDKAVPNQESQQQQNQIQTLKQALEASKIEFKKLKENALATERYLSDRIIDLEETNRSLNMQNEILEEKLSETKTEMENIAKNLMSCEEDIACLREINEKLQTELTQKTELIGELKQNIEKDKEKTADLFLIRQQEIDRLKRNLTDTRIEISKLTQLNRELTDTYESKLKGVAESNLKSNIDKLCLIMKLNQKDEKIKELDSILDLSKEEVAKLQERNKQLVMEQEKQPKECKTEDEQDELQDRVEKAEQEIQDLKEKLDAALNDAERLKEINYDLQKIIEENVRDLQKAREEMTEERAALNAQIREREFESDTLKSRLASAIADLTLAKICCNEIEHQYGQKLDELEKDKHEINTEKEMLLERLQEKDKEIEEMIKRLEDLQEEMDNFAEENEKLQSENEERFQELEDNQQAFLEEKEELLTRLQKALTEVDELKKELEDAQITNENLRNRENIIQADFEDQIDDLEEENDKLRAENMDLITKVEEIEKELQEEKDKVENHEQNIQKMESQHQEHVEGLNKEKSLLEHVKVELEEKLHECQEEKENLQSIIKESQEKLDDLNARAQEIHEKFERNAQQMKEMNDELTSERDILKSKLKETSQQAAKLKLELSNTKEINKEIRAINQELQEEIEYLEDKIEDLNKEYREEKDRLIDELAQVEDELLDIKEKMINVQKENDRVSAVYQEALSQKAFLEEKLEENKRILTQEKEEVIAKMENLSRQHKTLQEDHENQSEELCKLQQLHEELESKHCHLQERISLLENAHSDLAENHTKLLESSTTTRIEKEELEKKLHITQEKLADIQITKASLENRANTLEESLRQMEEQCRHLRIEKCLLRMVVQKNEQDHKTLNEKITQANNIIADLGLQINQLKEENTKLQQKLEETIRKSKEEKAILMEEKSILESKLQSNKVQINTLQTELKEQKTKATQLEVNLKDMSEHRNKIEKSLKSLENEKAILLQDMTCLKQVLSEKEAQLERIQKECQASNLTNQAKTSEIQELTLTCIKLKEKIKEIEVQHHNTCSEKDGLIAKLHLKDKEIDYLKLNLGECKNKIMGQNWALQEIKGDNSRLTEKLRNLEINHERLKCEKENLAQKNLSLENTLKETESQREELSHMVEELTIQKEKQLIQSQLTTKSLTFELELLNINIQSKEEDNKTLNETIKDLKGKLDQIDQINNPEPRDIQYDVTVEMNPILNISRSGIKCTNHTGKTLENLNSVIGLIGLSKSGKTHLMCQINNEIGVFDLEPTTVLGFKLTKDSKYLILDSQGVDSQAALISLRNSNMSADQVEMEDKVTEFFTHSYIADTSNVLVLVMNTGCKREDEILKQMIQKHPQKQIIVIHNLKDTSSLERLKKIWNNSAHKQYNLESKKIIYDFEPLTYFEQNSKGKRIFHLIMAKEGTPAGDVYNRMSLKALSYILNMEKPQNATVDPVKSVALYNRRKLQQYLLDAQNNQPVSDIDIETTTGDANTTLLKTKGQYKLKPYAFDSLGRLQQINEEENDMEYLITRKNQDNVICGINIPQLLEETIKITMDKLSGDSYVMHVEGNRMIDQIINDMGKIMIDHIDHSKEFKLSIPIKCTMGEMLATDQEEMEIDYENGMLMIAIPVYKDNEFNFEML